MNTTNIDSLCTLARNAVRLGSEIAQSVQRSIDDPNSKLSKDDRSPVTIADFAVQAIIIRTLKAEAPEIPVMAEEDSQQLSNPQKAELCDRVLELVASVEPGVTRSDLLTALDGGGFPGGREGDFWVLDPIDGTKGFLRGDQYAIALGLVRDGKVVLGVLGCPNLTHTSFSQEPGLILHAVKDGGAWIGSLGGKELEQVHVRKEDAPSQGIVCQSFESGHSAHGRTDRIAARLGISHPSLRIDSQCKYAMVALGEATIYLRLPRRAGYREKIWDHAAGVIVVEEAGGQVSDVAGQPLDFGAGRFLDRDRGIVVTNREHHDLVLESTLAEIDSE
jgi:HAL2 family 3'(2'),5'-bisphosphate nucleotidase